MLEPNRVTLPDTYIADWKRIATVIATLELLKEAKKHLAVTDTIAYKELALTARMCAVPGYNRPATASDAYPSPSDYESFMLVRTCCDVVTASKPVIERSIAEAQAVLALAQKASEVDTEGRRLLDEVVADNHQVARLAEEFARRLYAALAMRT